MPEKNAQPVILIVEDEPLILGLAQTEFEEAGFDVLTAVNSEDALALIDGNADFDVLFTDIRMPGPLDGWALAKRAREVKPALGVIYATGYSAEALQVVDRGVFVTKPYVLDQVIETARSLHSALGE